MAHKDDGGTGTAAWRWWRLQGWMERSAAPPLGLQGRVEGVAVAKEDDGRGSCNNGRRMVCLELRLDSYNLIT